MPRSDAVDALATYALVDTRAGQVRGVWRGEPGSSDRSAAFFGIPFAEPPVGELRFAAPVPHRPWEGVRDALEPGATAQRGDSGVTLIPETSVPGESTLNVNVFTPSPVTPALEPADDPGLPVLVWIHGGGWISGSPSSPWYDGRRFNRDGVVTVSISYRLGFDGFGVIAGAPANRGVRDWLLALEWVQDNIAAFGGDPARVTIAGQSAGGGAVETLLGMEAAQHLFHAVYSMSGSLADVSAERAAGFAQRLADDLGVEATRAGFSSVNEAQLLEAQRRVSKLTIGAARRALSRGLVVGPCVDGELIVRPTNESLRAGIGADKPLVIGAADDEFTMMLSGHARALRGVPRGLLLRVLGLPRAAHKSYLAANAEVASRGTARIGGRFLSDQLFRKRLVETVTARGEAPTWVYRFAWPSGRFGFAEHCLDVPFFFDCLDSPIGIGPLAGPNPPQALADDVHGGAIAFVRTGEPGWPRYDAASKMNRVFDTPSSVEGDGYAGVGPLL